MTGLAADLAASMVNPKTRHAYNTHIQNFNLWFQTLGQPAPCSFSELDTLLAQYFALLYDKNPTRGSRQSCVLVRSGILLYCPEARHSLPFSQRVLAGWDKRHPSTQNLPCPYELVLAFAEHFLIQRDLECAVLVLLAFDSYLRVSELLGLTPAQVSLPSDVRPGGVFLPVSKRGRNQSVLFRSPTMIALFTEYLKKRPASESRVFTRSPLSFNAALKRALIAMGVDPSVRITAHSLRHGGASHDFMSGIPMADIIQRGRWKDPRTAQVYIQSGQSLLLATKLPGQLVARARAIRADASLLLSLVAV